jgi:hypothetical protein
VTTSETEKHKQACGNHDKRPENSRMAIPGMHPSGPMGKPEQTQHREQNAGDFSQARSLCAALHGRVVWFSAHINHLLSFSI